ncbi:hypothetical protein [Nocardia grenadensis]
MQLVTGADTDRLSAWYVGQQAWTLPWMQGRTVDTLAANAAVHAGEALQAAPPPGDPRWRDIRFGADALGLTVHELAVVLGVTCTIPDLPPRRARIWLPGERR